LSWVAAKGVWIDSLRISGSTVENLKRELGNELKLWHDEIRN